MHQALRANQWYNGDWFPNERGMIADRVSRIMGHAVIRQLRVKPGKGICTSAPLCNGAINTDIGLLLELNRVNILQLNLFKDVGNGQEKDN